MSLQISSPSPYAHMKPTSLSQALEEAQARLAELDARHQQLLKAEKAAEERLNAVTRDADATVTNHPWLPLTPVHTLALHSIKPGRSPFVHRLWIAAVPQTCLLIAVCNVLLHQRVKIE